MSQISGPLTPLEAADLVFTAMGSDLRAAEAAAAEIAAVIADDRLTNPETRSWLEHVSFAWRAP